MVVEPRDDLDVPRYWQELGLPGLADIHVHFLPDSVLTKVWEHFDGAADHYGRAWPVQYRFSEVERLATARALGLRAIPSLCYPHKPGMAAWLNDWCTQFAARVPDAVHSATAYPEPGAGEYLARAISDGARLVKLHVQVGAFDPSGPLMDPVWDVLAQSGTPVVIHAGSAPLPGPFTGVEPICDVVRRFPELVLVIAHLGMSEYDGFASLAERHDNIHLDTTMVATDFTNDFAPLPPGHVRRMAALRDKIVLGSDFPNIPYAYAHQLQALHRLDLGEAWLRAVLWDNGARLMGLPQR